MRVGVAISTYRRSGGLERVAGEWARGLASRGHEVTVFAQTAERGPGDERVRFERVGGLRSPIAGRAATFPPAATASLRRHPQDVVVSFGCTVLAPAVVRLPGAHRPWWELANREAPITTPEGLRRRLNPHHAVTLGWERMVLNGGKALRVLAASDRAAEDIRRCYPRAASLTEVVPDGIDLDGFRFDAAARDALREEWDAREAFVVLNVATEIRRKGIAHLLRAFALIARERADALLVVAGTAAREEVSRLAGEAGLAGRVRAVGFVPDIRAAYCAADVLLFPTVFDPWGLPVAEALACGTPVASSRAAGASSVVLDGETGVVFDDPADAASVARSALAAASLPASRDGVRASVEGLAWPRVVDAVERVLRAVRPDD